MLLRFELMGETATPHFYDFGVFGLVPEPQNQLFLSLETPRYLTKSRKKFGTLETYIFLKIASF